MATGEALDRGRQAFAAQAWSEAYVQLRAADHDARLEPDDLLSLALASILTGHDEESDAVLARAHEQFLARGEFARAAQSAIWLGMSLLNGLELVRGYGTNGPTSTSPIHSSLGREASNRPNVRG